MKNAQIENDTFLLSEKNMQTAPSEKGLPGRFSPIFPIIWIFGPFPALPGPAGGPAGGGPAGLSAEHVCGTAPSE